MISAPSTPQPLRRIPLLDALLALALFAFPADAKSQVLISQVYGGGGNTYQRDYVELFNRGPFSISLDGTSIQYASAGGTGFFASNGITLLSGTLDPGRYLLVGLAAAPTGAALPPPFVEGNPATNLAAASGKVALVASTSGLACNGGATVCSPTELASILDLIGYGTANFFEGASAAPPGSTTTSLHRASDGCMDTHQNGNDFASGLPVPRNALTSPTPCPTVPTVELSLDASTGSETAMTTITATVTASAPVVGDQTVALVIGGEGITTGDYVVSTRIVTLVSGTQTGSALFTVVDDGQVEGTETATLSLGSASAGIAFGSVTSRNLTLIDGDGCSGTSAVPIHAVQGDGAISPFVGMPVTIEGIVIGRYQGTSTNSLQGFFVQEEDADIDGDPMTSEGLFVYEGSTGLAAGISLGTRVRVSGTVVEFAGLTELSPITSVQICATGDVLPTASTLTLPVPGVPNGSVAVATAAIDAYYERFEGMRITIPATLSLAETFDLERFGQITLHEGGRLRSFTDANAPNATGWIDHQIDVSRRSILLDDGDNRQQSALTNGTPLPHPHPGLSISQRFRAGDTITGLTGILDRSPAGAAGTEAWRVRPVPENSPYTFVAANPRPTVPPSVGGDLFLTSMNLADYFSTIDTTSSAASGPCGPDGLQECRGADSAAELVRQTDKLVAALCLLDADVVALTELQNDAFATANALVSALNAVPGCGPYGFINSSTIGSDAIKVGLLYRSTTISVVASPALLDASVDPRFLDTKNRPVLAQTLVAPAIGSRFTVAVAHLKAKGAPCDDVGDPDLGDGQGACSATRTSAAEALVDWLATDPTASGDPDFLILGDLNSYAQEDPIRAIREGADDDLGTNDDYVDLIEIHSAGSGYGFVLDGQVGRLDHALATLSLASQITGAAPWHINADEPAAFDYDDTIADVGEGPFEAKPSALPLYAPDAFRSSDHDPIRIGLPEPALGTGIGITLVGLSCCLGPRVRRRAHRIRPRERRRDAQLA